MYLAALLSAATVKEDPPASDEILLLPAGAATGVELNMVVPLSIFESVLVKYRASEPQSEAVLLALGTAKSDSTSVWNAMLQSEFVLDQYTKLCDSYHAHKLEMIERAERGEAPPPKDYEEELPETAKDPSVIEMVDEYMAQLERASDHPAEETVQPGDKGDEPEETYQAAATAAPEMGHEVDPSSVDWGDVIKESAEQADLPEGYAPPEVEGQRQKEAMESLERIMDDALQTFTQYKFSYTCKCTGTTVEEVLKKMSVRCPSVYDVEGDFDSEEYIRGMLDIVKSRCEAFVIAGQYGKASELLKPITNILYEE